MKKRSNKNHLRFQLLVALWFLATTATGWAAVELRLDRQRVMVGETVTLTFITDDSSQSLEADFSVLEEDFDILDRRSESQLSIVNDRQTALVRLLITVEPKHDGDIVIPAFQFGKESTEPVSLRVEPAPELAPGELPPVFIEVEITPAGGPYYVHAQFGLVVRVFYQQNLTEAAISQPDPAPASVRLLQETPYQAERGGERYRVLERHYAIFPERSGELIIPAMELSGRLVERRANSIWQPTQRGRRVRAESEPLTLQIEPRPPEFTGSGWQPAREFKISQQVSSADSLRVGEPVTRTVLIDAAGLEENMILEPEWPELQNARIYPDQPQGITRDDGRWVLGHKEFRYAVVPEKEGELVLPELRVDWWDTRANTARTAVLPPHRLQVQPSTLAPPPVPSATPQASPEAVPAEPVRVSSQGAGSEWKIATLVFAVLWLGTAFLAWHLGRRRGSETPSAGAFRDADEAALLNDLKRACENGDRGTTRRRLQRWLQKYGPGRDPSLLAFAATCEDEALRRSVHALDSEGFRREPGEPWDGRALWKQFEAWRKRAAGAAAQNRRPPTELYAPENRVIES